MGRGSETQNQVGTHICLIFYLNVLVTSFCFILIPILWIYEHYTYLTLSVRRTESDISRRQIRPRY